MNYALYSNDLPVCPHCNKMFEPEDVWDMGMDRDEEVEDFECGSCEKEFKVQLHVKYTYTTCPEKLADYYED